jgi:glycine/D-amino acid oxidase-like deaminating enzyme
MAQASQELNTTMSKNSYDVIIVGGGIMGCATAYYLMMADDRLKVAVVEMDPTYARSSTTLSVANVRVQFNLKENIQISQYALEVLERFDEDMAVGDRRPEAGFRRQGNLFVVDEESREQAEKGVALQKSLGCQVEWLSPEDIKSRYPLYDPEGYAGATLSPQDGTMDAYGVLMGYRDKAKSLGAKMIHDEGVELLTSDAGVIGARLASGETLIAGYVVNCAGAWAGKVAQTAGVTIPVKPIMRQVFALDPAVKPERDLPLTVLPSGLYFTTETGDLIVCGKSLPEDPVGFDFVWDRQRFTEHLWPELVELVPAFDRLKLVRGWAGLYAVNTLDGNAILGEWPELRGFYLATGFSGHGFQQAHAVGRYLSELITGQRPTLDLSVFTPGRILDNRPVFENELKLV